MVNSLQKDRRNNIFLYTTLAVLGIMFVFPIYYTFINAIRSITAPAVSLFPKDAHFENFIEAITRISFLNDLRSSVIIVSISIFFSIFINFILGYAFARMNAPGKDMWFAILISLMMVPTIAMTIPQYILFSRFHITNTYWIWILNGLGGSPFYTFLYRQFMQTIPKDLEEAARIDGCSTIKIMLKIFVPITIPVTTVIFMFEFLSSWGDVYLPFMYLNENKWPLSMALMGLEYTLPNNHTIVLQPLQLACGLLFIIPPTIAFFIGQKYIKEGMITSGLKG